MSKICISILILLFPFMSISQSVEIYAGHQRSGVDLLWYKFFKNRRAEKTPFLFFSRNRASTDYKNEVHALGSVQSLSYNFANGLGLVAVGTFSQNGYKTKLGIQYIKSKGSFLFFGWAVIDASSRPNIDVFGLFRFTPPLHAKHRWFLQAELYPIFQTYSHNLTLIERIRVGVKSGSLAYGLMGDFQQNTFISGAHQENIGLFIRQDF